MGNRLWRLAREEEGIALIVAIVVSAALVAALTTVLLSAASSSRTSAASSSRDTAYRAAEAGIAVAMSILADPTNNALYADTLPPPPPSTSAKTTQLSTGKVVWGGTLSGSLWTITSIGYVKNPTGPGSPQLLRKLTATVNVKPTLTQPLNNPAWNYVYTTRPPSLGCDETLQQSVTIASPFYVNGNLCLQNTATIVSGPLVVRGWLQLQNKGNSVGSAAAPISDAHIANGCQYQNGAMDKPCKGAVDNVFARTLDASPTTVVAPVVYWDNWYLNASPGPYFPCTTSSGIVPVFDNDQGSTQNIAKRNNSVPTIFNLTPPASYTCRTAAGELSWDATAKKLTVSGTVFIDGSAYISNGAVNTYTGQAALYLSGTFLMKNAKLCAGLAPGGSTCDTSTWDPNKALLAVVANGSGGQVNSWDGAQFVSAFFQGAVYATKSVDTDTTSGIDGPICGDQVNLGQSVTTSFPTILTVPVGMPSNPTVYAQPDPPVMSG